MTKKRRLIRLMRTKGITALEAAETLDIPKAQVLRWLGFDREFIRAWEAISVVRAINHILFADDLVRGGKRLTLVRRYTSRMREA
jgi:hypothetical protein